MKIFIHLSLIAFVQNVPVTRRVRRKKLELKKEKEEVLKKLDPKSALQGMVQATVQKAVGEV